MSATLGEIANFLGWVGTAGNFATRRTCRRQSLRLEVEGVGPISLPIASTTARKLCTIAQPARHGYKEETRLDRTVRDGWEIPAHVLADFHGAALANHPDASRQRYAVAARTAHSAALLWGAQRAVASPAVENRLPVSKTISGRAATRSWPCS